MLLTLTECKFLVLAKLPNGDIHQVSIKQDEIKHLLLTRSEFNLVEGALGFIDFDIRKDEKETNKD